MPGETHLDFYLRASRLFSRIVETLWLYSNGESIECNLTAFTICRNALCGRSCVTFIVLIYINEWNWSNVINIHKITYIRKYRCYRFIHPPRGHIEFSRFFKLKFPTINIKYKFCIEITRFFFFLLFWSSKCLICKRPSSIK